MSHSHPNGPFGPRDGITVKNESEVDGACPAPEYAGLVERTLTDTQRLLWREDVEAVCPSIDMCFEYGETVRCGPCAIAASRAKGIEPNMSLPNLPEVSRLTRENATLTERNKALEAEVKALRKQLSKARTFIGGQTHTKRGEKLFNEIQAALGARP